MTRDELLAACRTVVQMDDYFAQLKAQALAIFDPTAVSAIGYITPSQEQQIRQLQVSYWQARNALFELIHEVRRDVARLDDATPEQFLVALAAAALLADAAWFLRETFHGVSVVRRKLDEPDPVFGIPPRMYDSIQKSLTDPYHAWHLWQATRYFDTRREKLRDTVAAEHLEPLLAIIDRHRDRLRPSLWMYLRTRLRVRGRRAMRRVGRDLLGRALYAVQESVSRGMSNVTMRPGHVPGLPPTMREQVTQILRPGDVLIVRKEFAATNYFLPGYWPHAALYLGACRDLEALGIVDHQHVRPRLPLLAATPSCVLEALKDGVRVRPVDSPLASDSIVVIRPLLGPDQIAAALAQAMMHEGKPYDFDFDFCYSHRLVCTEVVYRAYEGVAGVSFELRRHAGRFALAAGELLRMAVERRHFETAAVYSPSHSPALETGPAATEIVRRVDASSV